MAFKVYVIISQTSNTGLATSNAHLSTATDRGACVIAGEKATVGVVLFVMKGSFLE